jgi:hypothetical protein
MMFMIPMPPTTQRHRRDRGEQDRQHLRARLLRGEHLGQVADEEVVLGARLQAMALPQEVAHQLLGVADVRAVAHLDRDRADVARADLLPAEHALARGRDRDQHDVVLVLSDHALALALEQANDRVRHVADADRLADRVGLAEQRARDGLPDQRDLGRRVEIGLRELAARGERPFARDQVVGRDAEDLRRPVAVAEHDLSRPAQLRRRDLDLGNLARHQERVVLGKGLLRPRAHAHAAPT